MRRKTLANPPGFGAQWRVEAKVGAETVSLMPGGRDDAQQLAAVIRRRVPALCAAAA